MLPRDSIASLLDQFHAARPVRAWSLIITLYGDAIVPRGGSLWLGSLIEIMALFRIGAGHVRTAMSRLTADGWLERERAGRNSYYRLSQRGEGDFRTATRRIYFADEPPYDGRLRLALLGPDVDDRSARRTQLEAAGFAALSPTAFVAACEAAPAVRNLAGVFVLEAEAGASGRALAAAAWKLAPIAAGYRAFVRRFEPLEAALATTGALDPADALVARTLLIHAFRRIVLRDPGLPSALLPKDWPGPAARGRAARIYHRLVPASETYLDRHAVARGGPLPPPEPGFARRFAPPDKKTSLTQPLGWTEG